MRAARFVAILAFLSASGCYRYVGYQIAPNQSAEQPALRRNIRTFVVMSDGVRRPFRDAVIVGDSLYGWTQESGAQRANAADIPLERVQRVEQQKRNRVVAGLIFVAGVTLSVIGAIQIAAALHKRDPLEPL